VKKDSNEKLSRASGNMLALLLAIVWIVFLWLIERSFYPHLGGIQTPVFYLLYIGPIVFLVSSGDYLMYRRKLGGVEAARGIIGLKSFFLGILIWLPVTVVLLFVQWDGPWQLSPIGGLLTMIAIYLLWEKSAVRKNSPANAEQE